jgi:hypothetical protein
MTDNTLADTLLGWKPHISLRTEFEIWMKRVHDE